MHARVHHPASYKVKCTAVFNNLRMDFSGGFHIRCWGHQVVLALGVLKLDVVYKNCFKLYFLKKGRIDERYRSVNQYCDFQYQQF